MSRRNLLIFLLLILVLFSYFITIKAFYQLEDEYNSLKSSYKVDKQHLDHIIDKLLLDKFTTETIISKIYFYMLNKDYDKAFFTYKASIIYDIDPLLLTALINSESSYLDNPNHSLDYVKGLAGINHRYWDIPNGSIEEQILAGAYILSHYLDKYNGDELKALIAYKGKSELGKKLASNVHKKYMEMK
ncbi:hypothetical protein [Campylobacter fetus]|uniref:hypothetical protein n=1 Tax=Campylobacter fetus TaxID=196 RepID=UPI000818913E|nr:hypothetical protein [Campylobacter fetus]OCR88088.1 hypothetical protein CFT13S00388_02675 [Campylobacter fetus subsp. testudinum]RUT50959.1 hypothetical protein BWK67_00100 [Campylobacter fetus]RUT51687.1 hypothetical protein BWK51_00100 [Campylobacter fetus]